MNFSEKLKRAELNNFGHYNEWDDSDGVYFDLDESNHIIDDREDDNE